LTILARFFIGTRARPSDDGPAEGGKHYIVISAGNTLFVFSLP
jgi:hypothetical protein